MLFLEMYEADEASSELTARLREAIAGLPPSYKRLLGPAVAFQAEVLGVGVPTDAPPRPAARFAEPVVTFGEVLAADGTLIGVVSRTTGRSRYREVAGGRLEVLSLDEAPVEINVFSLGTSLNSKSLDVVVKRLSQTLEIEFRPFRYRSGRFNELRAEGMEPPEAPTDDEKKASRLLADKSRRILALAIKSSGGMLLGDAPKQLPPDVRDQADRLIAELQQGELISTEIVVICTRTSTQVARAASRKQLEQSAASGIVCACGRPLTAERVEEALTITDGGRELLDGSRWMSILLVDELLRLGIPLDRILIEQQAGGDEMDCFADVSGDLVFFELKDKEFNLGSAYSFGAKIGIAQPDFPIIVTTEYVGNDAKEHFQRAEMSERRSRYAIDQARTRQVRYIEGIETLRPQLEELVGEIYKADGIRLLSDVLPLAALEPVVLLEALGQRREESAKPEASSGSSASRQTQRSRRTTAPRSR